MRKAATTTTTGSSSNSKHTKTMPQNNQPTKSPTAAFTTHPCKTLPDTTTPSPPPSSVTGARLGRKQPRTLQKGRPSSLAVSLTLPRRLRVVCPASRHSRSWTGHGSQIRGLSQKGSAMKLLPQRALPRKRSTLASPGLWMSPPARPTARSSPTHLPDSGIRSGYRHRAS